MFATPGKGSSVAMLAEPIDVDQRYLVRLVKLIDEGVSKFDDPTKRKPGSQPDHSIKWVFRVATLDRAPLLTIDDEPYEHFEWTSQKTGKGNGKTAKARLYMEALLGRPLEDEEINAETANAIIDKVAVCLFENREGTDDVGTPFTRVKVLRLSPYKEGAKSGALPPAPSPAPVAAAVADREVAARKAQKAVADAVAGSDLPWDGETKQVAVASGAPAF